MVQQPTNTEQALRRYCERIEALKDEMAAIAEDIKTVRKEAKMEGFDLKVLNEMLKLRAMDGEKRADYIETRDLYEKALGM